MAEAATKNMRRYQQRLRPLGLRPVQVWMPDLGDPVVRARLAADVRVVRDHSSTAEGDTFVEAALAGVEDWEG